MKVFGRSIVTILGARCGVQVTNWSGACYIFPLLGAFIADSYLGRYTTIIVFSTLYTIVQPTLSSHCILLATLLLGCCCRACQLSIVLVLSSEFFCSCCEKDGYAPA